MIITITLNPTMDKTVELERLLVGDANRVVSSRTDPGGKGINVSRVIRELGEESLAMGFVSGSIGRFVEASLNEIGIRDDFIHTAGQTRTNITIVDLAAAIHTAIDEKGPDTELRHVGELKTRLRRQIKPKDWVVIAGSAPPPLPDTTYAELILLIHEQGALPILDADGGLLAEGIKARPYLIKPNRQELERLVDRDLPASEDVVDAAHQLHQDGIAVVVVSMGKDGSIAVSAEGTWKAEPPEVEVVSAVGSGDSLVAGIVLALSKGQGLAEGLRLGTAAGAATALTPGTMLCRREDVHRLLPLVKLERLD